MTRTRLVTLRVAQKDFDGWKLSADGEGVSLSEWLRTRLKEGGGRGRTKPGKPHSPVLAPPSLSPDVGKKPLRSPGHAGYVIKIKKCPHGIEEGMWCRECRKRV